MPVYRRSISPKSSLDRLVTEFAESTATEDWITVVRTSNPEQPMLANEPVTKETLPTLRETIDQIESTDKKADYAKSLTEFRRHFGGTAENVSRVAYVFSDLREIDWQLPASTPTESTPNELLNQLAPRCCRLLLDRHGWGRGTKYCDYQFSTIGFAGGQPRGSICR